MRIGRRRRALAGSAAAVTSAPAVVAPVPPLDELVSLPLTEEHLAVVRGDTTLIDGFISAMIDRLTGWTDRDPSIANAPFSVGEFLPERRDEGLDWPLSALSMAGRRRLHNFHQLIESVLSDEIPGHIVETGVWRGGASILARIVLAVHGVDDRQVILADSFQGLPPPDPQHYPHDARSELHLFPDLAVSLDQVKANFATYGVLDDQVRFVEGWFRDTMPALDVDQIAVLRLDGDMYVSTMDPLLHLFDRVASGGYVIIDDYHIAPACRQAVQDFFSRRGVEFPLRSIDRVGAYFRKS